MMDNTRVGTPDLLVRLMQSGQIEELKQTIASNPTWLEVRDYAGRTPLRNAVELHNIEAVALLIKVGADINVRFNDGYSILHCAIDESTASVPIAAMLLEHGANVNSRGINDWTPLHQAVAVGTLDHVYLMIKYGANLNARTRIDEHETPLMIARRLNRIDVAQILVDAGAGIT